ncbi:MAG: ABC transporter ATP-binding protein [Pirellula sp.]|jgi:ABC-2 type transport system ATP-binding protein|nr:ABC transporter ATP-binding protein [Pirellula sp.]
MPYVIETHALCRAFAGKLVVDDLNLRVELGTFYGFLGPNGAGKSTTIKMLTGLLSPTSGSVQVLGLNMLDPSQSLEAKRSIGVIPENLALFDNLSGIEYLTFIGRVHGLDRQVIRSRSGELLQLLSLDGESKKLTMEYSHGMRKKLSLAAALLANPKLLFLDEPFEGVDAVASLTIRDLLNQFVQRGGTVFLTSHVLEIVQKLCSHVGIIVRGRLVQQRSMQEILADGTLEQSFLSAAGSEGVASAKLDWLDSSPRNTT